MTSPSDRVKQSDLLNKLILDRHTMAELGQVEVLWMYPKVHRVLGFIGKTGFLGNQKFAFNLNQLHTLGAKTILVNSEPTATDADNVRQLETLVNAEVWTDDGNKIGKISDYLFNLKTGEIHSYLFVSNGWSGITGSFYQLPPRCVLSYGNKRVLVAESTVEQLEVYRSGLQEKINQATDLFKEEKTHVTAEFRSLFKQAKTATLSAKERAQLLAEQAKAKAQVLNEQFLETTQHLAQQAVETSQMLAHELADPASPVSNAPVLEDDWEDDWEIERPPSRPSSTPAAPVTPAASVPAPAAVPPPQAITPPAPIPPPATATAPDADLDDFWDDEWETESPPVVSEAPATPTPPQQSPPSRTPALDDDDDEPWI